MRAALEIILVSGLASGLLTSLVFAAAFGRERLNLREMDAGFFASYMLFESAVTFLILWALAKARRETFAALGLRRRRWKGNVLAGIIAAPCLVVVSGATGAVFRTFLPEYALEKNPLTEMITSPEQLALFIVATVIGGGVKEELQRAFILRRFRRSLGGAKIGLFVWSIVFGLGHYAQGAAGICAAAVLGFIFGALYLMRGNLLLPITAHSVYNALVLFIYWFTIGINN